MKERARYQRRLADEWKASGLSQVEFYRRRSINGGSFCSLPGGWVWGSARRGRTVWAIPQTPSRWRPSGQGCWRRGEAVCPEHRDSAIEQGELKRIAAAGVKFIYLPKYELPKGESRMISVTIYGEN